MNFNFIFPWKLETSDVPPVASFVLHLTLGKLGAPWTGNADQECLWVTCTVQISTDHFSECVWNCLSEMQQDRVRRELLYG